MAHPPLAVICSDELDPPQRGRRYPWGTAASEADTEHAQLAALRRFLLTDGLLALKQASQAHYEAFRRTTLRRRRRRRAVVAVIAAAIAPRLARLGREEWRLLLLTPTPAQAPARANQWWRE